MPGEQEQVVGDIAAQGGPVGQGLKTKNNIKYNFLACHAKKVPQWRKLNCQHFGGERKEGRPVRAFREKAEGRREFSVQCLPQTTLHLQVHLLRDRKCGKENKDLVPFLVSALLTIVSKEVKTWLFVSAHST